MAITQDRSAIIWKEDRKEIPDILEKGLEYLVNLLLRHSICPGHVTYIANGPRSRTPFVCTISRYSRSQKASSRRGKNKAFTSLHNSSSFLVLLIIVQQVQNKAGADPCPGPVAAQAMKLAARELAAKKSTDHDREGDELPTQA